MERDEALRFFLKINLSFFDFSTLSQRGAGNIIAKQHIVYRRENWKNKQII